MQDDFSFLDSYLTLSIRPFQRLMQDLRVSRAKNVEEKRFLFREDRDTDIAAPLCNALCTADW